jgi:hypothetical protein
MSGIQEKMTTALASKDQGNEAFKNGDIKKGRKKQTTTQQHSNNDNARIAVSLLYSLL